MRIPTLATRSLTLALTAALAAPSLAIATPVTGTPLALVAFGGSTTATSVTSLLPADIDTLDRDVGDHLLATVDASALPLSFDDTVKLTALMEKGTPLLLHMDVSGPEDLDRVSRFFGIAPAEGDVILRRERGTTRVFAPSQENPGDTEDLIVALAASEPSDLSNPSTGPNDHGPNADNGPAPLLPARRFDINLIDSQGEISGTAAIDVARNRTNSTDNKLVTITSMTTAKAKQTGIVDGSKTGGNLWSAKLPHEYRTTHTLTAGAQVTYLDYFPLTDGRTDFTQTDTQSRGFTIGGSTGSEISKTGKPDDLLAAKLPFNLSFGYEHKWQSSLSTTFKDYSMEAVPKGQTSVQWTAFIAPSLRNVLVKHWGAGLPTLVDDKLTPMMRSATLPAMSHWKIPGAYEGSATVSLSGGYTLESQEWWYVRSSLQYKKQSVRRDATKSFAIDMSDPYLSAEITVLIRSATGSGACLRDHGGLVDIAACQASDRSQMWGLDAASRYVNRQSGKCLSVQPATQSVVTVGCDNITYEKQWQWRADRLHSMIDHGRYRLYVQGGTVHYAAAEGRFADFPVNPFGAPLEPWTNYPSAPRVGVDYIPAPHGSKLEPVPSGYAQFPSVSDEQRWHLQVLRTGL